jgi:predicted O-methyltransferase YrrM
MHAQKRFLSYIAHMFNKWQLAKRYLKYYLTSSNGKGHGIHSPFVFAFVQHVLNDKRNFYAFDLIEAVREGMLRNASSVEVEDFGAGSRIEKTKRRLVKDIAKSSLKPKKYSQLMFRMVDYYQPKTIVELGTSFGITSAYLAFANLQAKVYTHEGSQAIAQWAQKNFDLLKLTNLQLIKGNFDETLSHTLEQIASVDFAFVDGNHRYEPSIRYFNELLSVVSSHGIIIMDDIHWSAEMEQAWDAIKAHPQVMLTVDLFFIGIVFCSPDFKTKQHFTIRY